MFYQSNYVLYSFLAGAFTFLITVFGSAIVFFFKDDNRNLMDSMLSLSAGIMMAASFFSLLNPAIEIAQKLDMTVWLVALCGFLFGGLLMFLGDFLIEKVSKKIHYRRTVGFKRCLLLFTSITLHNIPEGLVLGVSFGSLAFSHSTSIASSIALTIGIAIQNFPEGSAISLPMRREKVASWKAFVYGALSAIVEPIFAIIGAILVLKIQLLLPFILSATAGAMIFVIIMELIPESQTNSKKGLMTLFNMIGFSIMMIMELILG